MQRFLEDYIASNGSLETTKSARLILLGNGGAGKTSIVKRFMGEKLPLQGKATPRIEVRDVTIEGKDKEKSDIDLSIWDFGGQVIMHSTHSFFISSQSTYIIACNSRANEQPDSWLEMLQNRVNNRVTVLVVYTHCDLSSDLALKEESDPESRKAAWRRDNALRRKFGKTFNLVFHDVDLKPKGDFYGFDALKQKIISRASKEAQTMMDNDVRAVRDLSKALEKEKQPFIKHQALIKRLKDELSTDDPLSVFKLANNYGYIFPESPLGDKTDNNKDVVEDDFIWVSQKHWLTYGVYQLVNNDSAIKNNGVLTKAIIEKALKRNTPQRINKKGQVFSGKPRKGKQGKQEEALLYCDDGIDILRRILVNYRWAMRLNRHNELLLPLATSLDEPNEFAALSHEFDQVLMLEIKQEVKRETRQEIRQENSNAGFSRISPVLMHIELVNKPSDFFFKLATYLDAHLLKTNHLWRTGAILHFYGDEKNRALLEMPENILSLKIFAEKPEDQASFQQLLVINIKETLKSYDSQRISAHSSERISLGQGKSEMLSSDVITSLTDNEGSIERIKKQLMERGRSMSSITINGNVTGNVGDYGKFEHDGDIHNQTNNIDTVSKDLIEQLQKLAKALPEDQAANAKVINASVVEFEKAVKEPDEVKKKSYLRKGIDLAKDVVAVDKVIGVAGEYAPTALGYIDKLKDLIG